MKKSTIFTLILGSLFGGAVTHHVMKNKDVYKACYEVGKEMGENAANKILTKVDKKLDKKKIMEYDNKEEIHPIVNTTGEHFLEDDEAYSQDKNIPYTKVVERVCGSRYIEDPVLYDNKYNISKVYVESYAEISKGGSGIHFIDKPIGIKFNSSEDRDKALQVILEEFFNILKSKVSEPYGIDIKIFDELFGTHLYSDYFEDIGDAIYFWPTHTGFAAYQRDLKNLFTNDDKYMIYFGMYTPCSNPCISLNYHHIVDRNHKPKGMGLAFEQDELPFRITFFNEEDAITCHDEICSFIDAFDKFSYCSLKKLLAVTYNIYIHGDYTDANMYVTDARINNCTLQLEWTKEEDLEDV